MNQPLPVITQSELIKALQKANFYIHHAYGVHCTLRNPSMPALRITLPDRESDLSRTTLQSILKQANLTAAELRELL